MSLKRFDAILGSLAAETVEESTEGSLVRFADLTGLEWYYSNLNFSPTKEGWWWRQKHGMRCEIVYVVLDGMYGPGASNHSWYSLTEKDVRWAGPIMRPEDEEWHK